jgi:hypothetical protein
MASFDPQLIAQMRDPEFMRRHDAKSLPDGTILLLRWLPTSRGVGLAGGGLCGGCHALRGLDGTRIVGASRLANVSRERSFNLGGVNAGLVEAANRAMRGAAPFVMGEETLGACLYQAYGVPWLKRDPNVQLKSITPGEYNALIGAERAGGAITRWNGSPLFPAKMPDLIGVKDRKYLDHTLRCPSDFCRGDGLRPTSRPFARHEAHVGTALGCGALRSRALCLFPPTSVQPQLS